jgi:hypothetical protein
MGKYLNDVLKVVNGDLGELVEIGYLTEEEAGSPEIVNYYCNRNRYNNR